MTRTARLRRLAIVFVAIAVFASPLGRADIQGGLDHGYSDTFNYPGVTATQMAPLDQTSWQTFPIDQNGNPVPNVWMVGAVSTNAVGAPGTTVKALRETKTQTVPADPIAFVRNGNWQDMIVQATVAFDGPSQNSGVGLVFRSPVDPLTGLADRNNFYLFTEVSSNNLKAFPTGRAFALLKRVGGAYFLGAVANTYVNFLSSTPEFHVLKVVVSGPHILGYADGNLVMNVTDTPGDDVNGIYALPGPMLANGTAGVRTSNTMGIFRDFTVISNPGYEGRADAVNIYGQAGNATSGYVVQETGGDTGFQYHDHDFPTGASTEGTAVGPVSTGNGITAGALLTTSGHDGTTSSQATLLGATSAFTQTMPDGSSINVTVVYDSISAGATASCVARTSNVQIVNFAYTITFNNSGGEPVVDDGKVTDVTPPPNTVVADPVTNGNAVKITLNSQLSTTAPMRVDLSAVRIDFFSAPADTGAANTGFNTASVMLGNVVAGKLCAPVDV